MPKCACGLGLAQVDTLPCERCGGKTRSSGMGEPSTEDVAAGAYRVELHVCPTCGIPNRCGTPLY